MEDYRKANLTPSDRGMLDFAVKLTGSPSKVEKVDIDTLQAHGFGDEAIHEIVQITALFNYFDRLADGLGIDPEPEWDPNA